MNVLTQLQQQLAANARLLQLADEQRWETFADDVEHYMQQLNALCNSDFSQMPLAQRAEGRLLLETLLAQDAALKQRMQARMDVLSGEMATTRKSLHSSRAYNAC